uniref:Uncharacterized protein LOC104225249 n=1 Tax=Nicotiana sylvestris TaxID=4096 RepID=A0A1U7WKV7_NICSY|nr:PREDICTED: uncharacterized protein LOC104225249 [Nicotiana sylvestris]
MVIDESTSSTPDGAANRAISMAQTLDYTHPLYLHPSNAPSSLSVGIQLIGMENYTLWSRAMKFALLGRNKLGFVDGSVVKKDFEGELQKQWERCNAIVVEL